MILNRFYINRNFFIQIILIIRRSEEHTSELQSLPPISYAVFCLKKKNFFNDTATTEIYTCLHTLSLHDALPISPATAMERPLMAPSTSPICRALLVPTAWAAVPMPTPLAMGSVIWNSLHTVSASRAPTMPVTILSGAFILDGVVRLPLPLWYISYSGFDIRDNWQHGVSIGSGLDRKSVV